MYLFFNKKKMAKKCKSPSPRPQFFITAQLIHVSCVETVPLTQTKKIFLIRGKYMNTGKIDIHTRLYNATDLLLSIGVQCCAHVGIRVLLVPRDHLVSKIVAKPQGMVCD